MAARKARGSKARTRKPVAPKTKAPLSDWLAEPAIRRALAFDAAPKEARDEALLFVRTKAEGGTARGIDSFVRERVRAVYGFSCSSAAVRAWLMRQDPDAYEQATNRG